MRHLAGTRSTGFWGKFFGTKSVFALVLGLGWMVMAGIGSSQVEAADLLKAGFLEEPKTLNIMRASDRWSRRVLSLIYQSLYVRHPETLELVPWLAAEAPVYDAADLCYTVKLRPAKWSDGSEFTAADVAFTARLIQEFKVSRYLSKWKFVERIETPDKHTLKFYLTEPMAIFESRTLITPIVPKKQWEAIAEKARNSQ